MRHPYASALLQSIPKLEQDRTQTALHASPACRRTCRRRSRAAGSAPLPERHRAVPHRGTAARPRARQRRPQLRLLQPGRHRSRERRPVLVVSEAEHAGSPGAGRGRGSRRSPTGRPILEIDHLVKEFSVTAGAVVQRKIGTVKAVSDVTFSVRQGETFGLVGESGCGKTTIGRLIVGLERPNSGRHPLRGRGRHPDEAGRDLRRQRRDMQLMFQDPYASLDPRMRVGIDPREPLVVQGIGTTTEQVERVRELLERGRPVAQGLRPVPARVLRRPAAADRLCPSAHPQPEAHRRRRARLSPRRLHPGPDPQPDEGPAGSTRALLHRHLARPRRRQVPGRPDRRDVPRQARRESARRRRSTSTPRTRTRRASSTRSRLPSRASRGPSVPS